MHVIVHLEQVAAQEVAQHLSERQRVGETIVHARTVEVALLKVAGEESSIGDVARLE